MLPGIDNPGKHSLRPFYSNIMLPQFEYYYITLASPGRLYPSRWRHERYHCEVIIGAIYQSMVELSERNKSFGRHGIRTLAIITEQASFVQRRYLSAMTGEL
jgi:hypothetical protein